MPTNRYRRTRAQFGLDPAKREHLCLGPEWILLPNGYGELVRRSRNWWTEGDLALVTSAMEADWPRYRDEVLDWWTERPEWRCPELPGEYPVRLGPGTRPWAWWAFDAREALRGGEAEADYLDRLRLWRPGERERAGR